MTFLFTNGSINKYYTIKDGVITQLDTFDIDKSFNFSDIRIIKDTINLKYMKLVCISKNNIQSINIMATKTFSSYVLLNLAKLNINNIYFNSEFKFIVSDDLLNWHIYLSPKSYNIVSINNYNINELKHYINESKPLKGIDKKYNYVLLLLKKDKLNAIYKIIYSNLVTSTKSTKMNLVNDKIYIDKDEKMSYINYINTSHKNIISSMEEMKGDK